MTTVKTSINSVILNNSRRLWIQSPSNSRTSDAICILLDGEYYVERIDAPSICTELQASNNVPPFTVIYVSHLDGETRWTESFCNDRFARFLSSELVPLAKQRCVPSGSDCPVILGGLSLTGLAAAHAALAFPQTFSAALCQSASFWWSDNRIVEDLRLGKYQGAFPQHFRITCGSQETQAHVDHGHGLVQQTSQLNSNQAMRNALRATGHDVNYQEFPGGHDIGSWKSDLPRSLAFLLRKTTQS